MHAWGLRSSESTGSSRMIPLYLGLEGNGVELHLSEHTGDASAG